MDRPLPERWRARPPPGEWRQSLKPQAHARRSPPYWDAMLASVDSRTGPDNRDRRNAAGLAQPVRIQTVASLGTALSMMVGTLRVPERTVSTWLPGLRPAFASDVSTPARCSLAWVAA